MKKRTHFATAAAIAVLAMVCITLSACGATQANAQSAAKTSDLAIRRTNEIVSSIDKLEHGHFMFPSAFDEGFTQEGPIMMKGFMRSFRKKSQYCEYIDSLDNLYLLCARVSRKNDEISQKIEEIKVLINETRKLSKDLKKSKLGHSTELYRGIEMQSIYTRRNAERLYTNRASLKNHIKSFSKDTESMDIKAKTLRYELLLQRMDARLMLLEAIKSDLQCLNGLICKAVC